MDMGEFYVERVHCCVCDGCGKVPRLVFWKRDCGVCEGSGQRKILMSKALQPWDAEMVRQSAIAGSLYQVPTGWHGVANAALNRWF